MWPHFAWSVRAPRVSPDDLVVFSAKLRSSTFIFTVLQSFSLKNGVVQDTEVRGRIFAFAVHFDSSTSHIAGETVKWLKANKIKFIPAEKWTPNSREVSSMDFFGNGYLKSLIKKRHYKTFEGIIRCAKEEWLNIPLEMFQKVLSSSSERL